MKYTRLLLFATGLSLLILALALTASAQAPDVLEDLGAQVPFAEEWAGSGHADRMAEAFNHWNADDPSEIPVTCAKCHSTPGFLDFLGADGSAFGIVDRPAITGTVVTCQACHNQVTAEMISVTMPSGLVLDDLGREAPCMQCHQGAASMKTVDESIVKANATDEDAVSKDLGFTNIHYLAAAATQYGTWAQGGYQYPGKAYEGKFEHVTGYDSCVGCHDAHTLQLKVAECQKCHTDVKTVEDLEDVRMQGSGVDYNGNGNVTEGMKAEIDGLRDMLLAAIQAYAREVSKSPIGYTLEAYPYFFVDTNGDGKIDETEEAFTNSYASWTPRLAKAAYNYQASVVDPGAYAHNNKYIVQLLYDSIDDLNQKLSQPVDLSKAHRIGAGHFAGATEAFRHWDAEGMVPAACAKCHSGAGLPIYLRDKANVSEKPANRLLCTTCHDPSNFPAVYEVKEVKMPSGLTVALSEASDNLCLNCHQGRESSTSVRALIKDLDPDQVSDKLRFLNVHYLAAGATLFGTQAKGAYEYDGKTYDGQRQHPEPYNTCTGCHDEHKLMVKVEECGKCHSNVKTEEDLTAIKMVDEDNDGNGKAEGPAAEIDGMRAALLAGIQSYAARTVGTFIAFSEASYPYFFTDANANGTVDPDEMKPDNSYKAWTPRLLKAAYNFQYATKDPGAFAHNSAYIMQVLYDAIEDLGQKPPEKMVRPAVS